MLDGREGKIWQNGQQVSQQATVGRQEVRSYHDNRFHSRGLALSGVLGGNGVAGVCVTLACETYQYTAESVASRMVYRLSESHFCVRPQNHLLLLWIVCVQSKHKYTNVENVFPS